MRNNFFYILIICAFTEILTKNEEKKPAGNEPIKHSRDFYEEEAKKDIQNLLSSVNSPKISVEVEDDTDVLNTPKSNTMMARIDKVLENRNLKKNKRKQKSLRYNNQNYADNFNRGNMQNLPFNVKSNSDNYAFASSNINSVKNIISDGQISRIQVNQVGIKPDVYPILTNGNEYAENREVSSREDTIRFNDQHYVNDDDGSNKLMNHQDTNQKGETVIRTTIPVTENFDINELLNQLNIKRGGNILTHEVSDDNVRMHDYLNRDPIHIYSQSANHLRPGNTLVSIHKLPNDFNDDLEPEDHRNMIVLRNAAVKVNSADNKRLEELMKFLNIGKNLRTSHTTLSYPINEPSKQGVYRNRKRRSTFTQAGYTQDPDTCKTYNENLAKLWSNLSKLINVTEQPNDRALHNIAMIIQAYLEHQNAKQTPEIIKEKHEGPRDKISEIIVKIKKLLADGEDSAEKITKMIKKYLKPDYMDSETEDCKEVNQEYLETSVDLLYKIYLENVQCQGEEDGMARSEKHSLREKKGRTVTGQTIVSMATTDFKPKYQTILFGDELYNDFEKGKVPRRRRINKYRRVFKPSKNQVSRRVYRAGNENENEKLQTRSKSVKKKLKKSSLKSNSVKGRCETYAARQLVVSLRSVMERFIGLLECQLDNTLRSIDRDSKNPNYLYASKFYSEADSLRHKKMKSRSPAKEKGRLRNNLHKKLDTNRHDTSIENNQDIHMRDDEDSEAFGEYSFDQIKSMNSAMPSESRDTNDREPATYKNKQHGDSDYHANYNVYFQSPPLYDDYDGINKKHKVTHFNELSSAINPSSNHNKKTTRDKQSTKELASSTSNKEPKTENSDEYDTYYEEMFTKEPNNPFITDQQQVSSYVETPFTDLTKLRSEDQLIAEKSKTHAKSFESIAEFLKKARDSSLQTPEFAVPFALDTNKGYVELTHLIKYPKIIVYRPQFLVKNTMPYDDFLKTINNINMTNNDVRLMKIVRHLPDSSVKVLFETEDFEAPLEVRNLNENRRSGWQEPVENYQLESGIDTANESTNTVMTDEDSGDLIPLDSIESLRIDIDDLAKSDLFTSRTEKRLSTYFNPGSDSLNANEAISPTIYSENNSDSNSTLNSKTNASESSTGFSPILSISAGRTSALSENSSSDSNKLGNSAVGSDLGSQIGPSTELGSETLLKLSNKSNSETDLKWDSFIDKFSSLLLKKFGSLPKSHTRSQSDSHSSSHSSSISKSHTRSSSPDSDSSDSTDNSNQEVANDFYSSTQSVVLEWWRKWKNIVKDKIKEFVGTMASLAEKVDHVIKI